MTDAAAAASQSAPSASSGPSGTALARTPLAALHIECGARMVPFAGYEMPVQYPAGVLKEHVWTREKAGLFDVSHMGQIELVPKSGDVADAARALETLVPADILGLVPGRQRYAYFTDDAAGILDDLMVANAGDRLVLVVNAACKVADAVHLETLLSDACTIVRLDDKALIALQGPAAATVLSRHCAAAAAMTFMDFAEADVAGIPCRLTRSGYTGEDGYEISCAASDVEALARALLADPDVAPIGLGARDSLRLEAGLCLYGSDIDQTTTPVEADLVWAIGKQRRPGGARAGGYPGASIVASQIRDGAARKRVGLRPEGRAPVRGGAPLYASEAAAEPIGAVTSGGFGPTVGAPVAMGYLPAESAVPGTRVFAEVRGQRLPATVSGTPFVDHRYKR